VSVEVRLLGPVEAVADGGSVSLGGPRQRALLALLALAEGPVSTDRLADELWGGRPPAAAETTLRSYVSRLRSALGREAVVARGGGYALALDRERLDVHRFERLLEQGRAELARGGAGLARERLDAALALWRGPALQDVGDVASLAEEARRLEELRLACVEERIEARLTLGRHDELVAELQALVRREPLRERLRRQLVLALYRSGRQAEALAAYHDARRTLDEELGLEPGPELRELEVAILRQELPAAPPAAMRDNLPAPTTSFVGRERELAELGALLREHRLVTLTGMGGSGKTRLALRLAAAQAGAWADGVWLADLTAVADPALVPATVAAAVGADGPEFLLDYVRTRELLLVLDNCEHLVDACAELVAAVLPASPHVRVLATSRLPLGVPGELDYALDPLAEGDAVRLFVDRATAVRRDLQPDATVGAICRALDGLPLAIELAAARAKALSAPEIADRLDDRLRFLRAWQRVADPRHRTLETTMDWSYELLGSAEQELLRRLAVFAGGATADAVSEVCLAGDRERAEELVARLVDWSLVRVDGGEATRYRLLETVRQYATAKLAADPAAEDVRRRHAEHFHRLAEAANLSVASLGRGPQQPGLVLAEQHNMRAALDWAAAADVELALRIMLALENFWITQAPAEGERRYANLLSRADGVDVALRAAATRDYAACFDVQHRVEEARRLYELSIGLWREAADEVGVANGMFRVGVIEAMSGNNGAARRIWEDCLRVFRELGDDVGVIQAVGNLGGLDLTEGNPERGLKMIDEAAAMADEAGWSWWVGRALISSAEWSVLHGHVDEGERRARNALEISSAAANRQETLLALAVLARAAAARGDAARAAALWSTVEATDAGPGRFGAFDRDEYRACMPEPPWPEPLPLHAAVALALDREP
jgi:predicted ATPase/DNA-binding SARP family transcriptional activator